MKVKIIIFTFLFLILIFSFSTYSQETIPIPRINIGVETAKKPQDVAVTLQIIFLLTLLTLAPAIMIMVTSFIRIIVVFSFIRQALGTHTLPPNQVLVGLAIFLTFFIMAPTFSKINEDALQPYLAGKIDYKTAYNRGVEPLRVFMFKQTRQKDIALFIKLSKIKRPKTQKDVPTYVLIPAFMISELKTAFQIGFIIYVPFLIIDMVVASVLMAMGMLMLPPILISLPFKILLFVMVDGWHLITRSLVLSFR
jgi:flagellar biosynthetic protein FliP